MTSEKKKEKYKKNFTNASQTKQKVNKKEILSLDRYGERKITLGKKRMKKVKIQTHGKEKRQISSIRGYALIRDGKEKKLALYGK